MKEEINDELRQLLDALEEHGRNAKRQQQLGDLIDRLTEDEKTVELPHKHKKLTPIWWWAMCSAAACLAAWLLLKPATKQNPILEEQILVEETISADTTAHESEEKTVFEESVFVEEPIVEVKPVRQKKIKVKEEKPVEKIVSIPNEEIIDAEEIKSNASEVIPEEPLAVQSPKRRVIRSENLVGHERREKQAVEPQLNRSWENKTIFGQPQDPNMKNGVLAMEIEF
jgi:hypothetical protein